jgi:hypothetical protein
VRKGERQHHGGGEQDVTNLAHIPLRIGGAVRDSYEESDIKSRSKGHFTRVFRRFPGRGNERGNGGALLPLPTGGGAGEERAGERR